MFGTDFFFHHFYDLPLRGDILSKGVHSSCKRLERRLANPRVQLIILYAITLYRDGVWIFTSTWMIYVHQLATPATHVSLVKLFDPGHYYVCCLLQGLAGGR